MKHIKTYKIFESAWGKNPSINWELIQLAKDIALEYLDEELTLHWIVYFDDFFVVDGRYNHEEDTIEWHDRFCEEDYIIKDKNRLVYCFYYDTDKKGKSVENKGLVINRHS